MTLRQREVELLDAAYSTGTDDQSWLAGIHECGAALFDGHIGAFTYTATLAPDLTTHFHDIVGAPGFSDALVRSHSASERTCQRASYLSGPVVSLRASLGALPLSPAWEPVHALGVQDAVAAIACDPDGALVVLGFCIEGQLALDPRARRALARIAAHLGSGHRLRRRPKRNGDTEAPMAVIDGEGRVLHARGDAIDARESLRRAARSVDTARSRGAGESQLDLWTALTDGRWTLAEQFDHDGRRMFIVRENEPATRASHALRARERKVAALVAAGHPLKFVAYELGYSRGVVCRDLRSAMQKLGVATRAELIALHGSIVAASDSVAR